MPSHDLNPPVRASTTGTFNDYTDDLYWYFFEVSDLGGIAKSVFSKYLGSEKSARLHQVESGYELDVPIQCAPELVRLLTKENVAVYQVVRLGKSEPTR